MCTYCTFMSCRSPNTLQAWLRRKKRLSRTSRSWKTFFRSYLHISGEMTSSLVLTDLLKSNLKRKNLPLQCHAKMMEVKSLCTSTSMGYDVWWLVPSKNGNWYSNPSMLLHVWRLTVHLYGKVEGMWFQYCMLFPCFNHLCRVNLRKFCQLYGW